MSKKAILRISLILICILTILSIITLTLFTSGFKASESTIKMNNSFSITIPKYLTCRKANYALSSEISEHFVLEGIEKAKGINGYIQAWNMEKPITEYIESLENSLSASVYNYKKSPLLPMNGSNGYNISFSVKNDTDSTFVKQTIWQHGDKMYVLSLSVPSNAPSYQIYDSIYSELKESVFFT